MDKKPNTLLSKLGFMDDDLKTQKHDEIMIWLNKNIQRIVLDLMEENYDLLYRQEYNPYYDGKHHPQKRDPWTDFAFNLIDQLLHLVFRWEVPINTHTNYVVGFVDAQVEVNVRSPYIEVEHPELERYFEVKTISFEVKSTIPSLGELIRQINTYRNFTKSDLFVVVSPDDRFVDLLKQQGIAFVKYE